jgi:DNA-binding NarL/FixJ family response regulator
VTRTIRAVLVDDEALLRAGLATILDLQPDIEVVGQGADGIEALALVQQLRPDVLVLDITMPRLDGLGVVERLRRTGDATRVLLLTSFDRDDYLLRALRAGVGGFVLKDLTREQLADAVRTVARGDQLVAPSVTRRLIETVVARTGTDAAAVQQLQRLTARERDVLELVARGLSNQDIAARLVLGEATVKTHLGSIFAKCALRDRAQAVVLAYESGLVAPGGSE